MSKEQPMYSPGQASSSSSSCAAQVPQDTERIAKCIAGLRQGVQALDRAVQVAAESQSKSQPHRITVAAPPLNPLLQPQLCGLILSFFSANECWNALRAVCSALRHSAMRYLQQWLASQGICDATGLLFPVWIAMSESKLMNTQFPVSVPNILQLRPTQPAEKQPLQEASSPAEQKEQQKHWQLLYGKRSVNTTYSLSLAMSRCQEVEETECELEVFFFGLLPNRTFCMPPKYRLFLLHIPPNMTTFRTPVGLCMRPGGAYGDQLYDKAYIWLEYAFRGDKGAQYLCCDADSPCLGLAMECYDGTPYQDDRDAVDFVAHAAALMERRNAYLARSPPGSFF